MTNELKRQRARERARRYRERRATQPVAVDIESEVEAQAPALLKIVLDANPALPPAIAELHVRDLVRISVRLRLNPTAREVRDLTEARAVLLATMGVVAKELRHAGRADRTERAKAFDDVLEIFRQTVAQNRETQMRVVMDEPS
jgi:hypothetical protein